MGAVVESPKNQSPARDEPGRHNERNERVEALEATLRAIRAERDVLRQEVNRSRAVLRGAVEGILVADLATRSFRYANPAICQMLGYTAEEVCSLGVADIHPPDALPEVVAAFEAQARGEFLVAPNLPCLRKDGSVFYADISTGAIRYDGLDCNLGIFLDVTERWQTERALAIHRDHLEELVAERTQALHEAHDQLVSAERLAVLGKFAGIIAHEIRTPLTVIANATYYLQRALEDGEFKVKTQLERIDRQVVRTTEIIESILSLSRPSPPEKELVELTALARAAIEGARLPPSIEVAWETQGAPLRARADPRQITMALDNLIKNAVHAMSGKGRLTLGIQRASRDGLPGVQLEITDTGPGIPEDDQETIFEPLYTTKSFGVGLGLSIVKLILQRHDGTVGVASAAGRGASFTLWLPE